MPIYEFRCLKCNDCFEFLSMNQDDQVELRCPKCKSEDFSVLRGIPWAAHQRKTALPNPKHDPVRAAAVQPTIYPGTVDRPMDAK